MPRRNGHGIDLLADPTRRRIVSLLALNVFRPAKIARELELSRPAVSRQLRILLDAQLISRRRYFLDNRGWMYYIDPRKLGQITAWLAGTEVGRAFPTYEDRENWIRAMVPHGRKELDLTRLETPIGRGEAASPRGASRPHGAAQTRRCR